MKKYEYKIVEMDNVNEREFNKYGEEGWNIFCIENTHVGMYRVYMKR